VIDKSFLALLQNAALLLAAAFVYDVAVMRLRTGFSLLREVVAGFAIGCIGVIVMLTPWTYTPGIVFDTRSVLIGISALFLGWLPASVVMAITAGFRFLHGGVGAGTGVAVIVCSGIIGMAWRRFRRGPLAEISPLELYCFGIAVHLAMIAMMLTLPRETAFRVISNIFLPVMLIYPAVAVLLGMLMANRLRRERDAEELRGVNTFLDSIIENIPDMIFIKDAENLRFIRFNRAGEELLGVSRTDLIGKSDSDVFPKDQADFFTRKDREALSGKAATDILEESIQTIGKGVRSLHTKKVPLFDAQGKPTHLLGISEDITDRRQAEAERERLLSAIEQTGDAVIIMDPDHTIRYVNPAFTTVSGYTRKDAIGQTPFLLKSGRHDESFFTEMWAVVAGGDIFKGRIVNRRKDGVLYTEDVTLSPVFDASGKIRNYVGVSRDVTDELRMIAQLQQALKMEAVGRLAGGVAHDFNNMLGVILGHAEMAMEKADQSHPFFHDFEAIKKAAERSASLTRQLLAFARKQIVSPEALDINETVEGMLKMMRRLIGEDINLIWLPKEGLPPVMMDPGQIDQIMANLCLNGRDAIAGVGRIVIRTGMKSFDEEFCIAQEALLPGNFVCLSVSDDGCGMDADTLENIFEPFFTTKGLGQGTGLGLATVYGIVKQNKGLIQVKSEQGNGTTFDIYIPVCAAGNDAVAPEDRPVEIPRGHGECVLLVEDEPAHLEMARIMLEGLGYCVLAAGSPGEALRMAKEYVGRFDLLVTDVVMPEMNGRDLAVQLQSCCPDLRCLFMSGYTADIIAGRGVLEEGVHFIQKPFSTANLAVKIRMALA
jgi:PAS domain S-box-containing protein